MQKIQSKKSYFNDISIVFVTLALQTATQLFHMALCLTMTHHYATFGYKRLSSSEDTQKHRQKDRRTQWFQFTLHPKLCYMGYKNQPRHKDIKHTYTNINFQRLAPSILPLMKKHIWHRHASICNHSIWFIDTRLLFFLETTTKNIIYINV